VGVQHQIRSRPSTHGQTYCVTLKSNSPHCSASTLLSNHELITNLTQEAPLGGEARQGLCSGCDCGWWRYRSGAVRAMGLLLEDSRRRWGRRVMWVDNYLEIQGSGGLTVYLMVELMECYSIGEVGYVPNHHRQVCELESSMLRTLVGGPGSWRNDVSTVVVGASHGTSADVEVCEMSGLKV